MAVEVTIKTNIRGALPSARKWLVAYDIDGNTSRVTFTSLDDALIFAERILRKGGGR